RRGGARLAHEAPPRRVVLLAGRDALDGHHAPESLVFGLEDGAHASFADLAEHAVVKERRRLGSDVERQGGLGEASLLVGFHVARVPPPSAFRPPPPPRRRTLLRSESTLRTKPPPSRGAPAPRAPRSGRPPRSTSDRSLPGSR